MSLLVPCVLTVLLELLFFLAKGNRDRGFLLLCVAVNVATNLSLNLLLTLLSQENLRLSLLVYPLEVAVVAAEFFLLSAYEKGGVRLLALVFLANALSYTVGLFLFGHV